MTFRQILSDNRLFLSVWGILLAIGSFWIALGTKGDGVLFLNQFYTPGNNALFLNITYLGELIGFSLSLAVVLIFKQIRYSIGFLVLGLLVLSIPYLLKHYVFPDAERPISYLGEEGLNLVLKPNTDHSFPSGHTTAGFAYFSYLAFIFRSNLIKLFALVLATAVAVSRVYLVQHFVQDVVAGSVLGVAIAVFCVCVFAEANWSKRIRFFNIGLLT